MRAFDESQIESHIEYYFNHRIRTLHLLLVNQKVLKLGRIELKVYNYQDHAYYLYLFNEVEQGQSINQKVLKRPVNGCESL